jgi:hypothetical protein
MRRRRRKRALKWGPVLFVLLLGNVAAGLWLSPITAATSVAVIGADARDQAAIDQALQSLKKVPYLRAKPREVESQLQSSLGRLSRAELSSNIFGRGRLEVFYQEPVGQLEERPAIKLSKQGDLYADDRPFEGLPTVRLPKEALQPNLTMGSTVELTLVSQLCQRVNDSDLGANIVVLVDSKGRLCLNIGGGGLVVLGSSEKLDEKFKRLEAYVEENPEGLKQIKELNLTAPEHPTFTR